MKIPGVPKTKLGGNGKHLILDLDESMAHAILYEDGIDINNINEMYRKDMYELSFGDGYKMHGVKRPFLQEFLDTCFDEFNSVSVWSAGTHSYVHASLDVLMGREMKKRLRFVMTRRHCNNIKDGEMSCRFKPLENVYRLHPDMNSTNTFILDDRQDICMLNCMNNILIPVFRPSKQELEGPNPAGDVALAILIKWFTSKKFREGNDVQLLKADSPFPI